MLRTLVALLFSVIILAVFGQTGPGGVGNSTGTSSMFAWYRADAGVTLSGTTITGITNSAGVSALNLSETAANGPTLSSGTLNGCNTMLFNGSKRLETALGVLNTSNFVVDQTTTFFVSKANVIQNASVFLTNPLQSNPNTRFSGHIPWSNGMYFDLGLCCGEGRLQTGIPASVTSYNTWCLNASPTSGMKIYQNGSVLASNATTSTYNSHSTQRFNVGGSISNSLGFNGEIAELIFFRTELNRAERIIVNNYLAAKFGLNLATEDLYLQDSPANGNYDYDVAGIGQITSAQKQINSRGTGIIRIHNATGMDDNEFYFWGHNNLAGIATEFIDVPAGVQARFMRVWRGSELNTTGSTVDVGSVDIEFDLTNNGPVTASDLRLLVDLNNNGFFADDVPISGAISTGGGLYQFSGISALADNLRFTLGTINSVATPLPVVLVDYTVERTGEREATATWWVDEEENIEFYRLERSTDFKDWGLLGDVPAQGATSYQFTDSDPPYEASYYRLMAFDNNHFAEELGIRSVNFETDKNGLIIFQNIAQGEYIVSMNQTEFQQFRTYNELGQNITGLLQIQWISDDKLLVKTIGLATGIYTISIGSNTSRILVY